MTVGVLRRERREIYTAHTDNLTVRIVCCGDGAVSCKVTISCSTCARRRSTTIVREMYYPRKTVYYHCCGDFLLVVLCARARHSSSAPLADDVPTVRDHYVVLKYCVYVLSCRPARIYVTRVMRSGNAQTTADAYIIQY